MQEEINKLKDELESLRAQFEEFRIQNSQTQNPTTNVLQGTFGNSVDIRDSTGLLDTISSSADYSRRTYFAPTNVHGQIFHDKFTSQSPKVTSGDGLRIYDAVNNTWRFIVFDL